MELDYKDLTATEKAQVALVLKEPDQYLVNGVLAGFKVFEDYLDIVTDTEAIFRLHDWRLTDEGFMSYSVEPIKIGYNRPDKVTNWGDIDSREWIRANNGF